MISGLQLTINNRLPIAEHTIRQERTHIDQTYTRTCPYVLIYIHCVSIAVSYRDHQQRLRTRRRDTIRVHLILLLPKKNDRKLGRKFLLTEPIH